MTETSNTDVLMGFVLANLKKENRPKVWRTRVESRYVSRERCAVPSVFEGEFIDYAGNQNREERELRLWPNIAGGGADFIGRHTQDFERRRFSVLKKHDVLTLLRVRTIRPRLIAQLAPFSTKVLPCRCLVKEQKPCLDFDSRRMTGILEVVAHKYVSAPVRFKNEIAGNRHVERYPWTPRNANLIFSDTGLSIDRAPLGDAGTNEKRGEENQGAIEPKLSPAVRSLPIIAGTCGLLALAAASFGGTWLCDKGNFYFGVPLVALSFLLAHVALSLLMYGKISCLF